MTINRRSSNGLRLFKNPPMRVGMVPLDERPATLRYPVLLGAIAGIEVVTPPPGVLGAKKKPMDVKELAAWIMRETRRSEALIVSCEAIAHGGLIPSRVSHESAGCLIQRLDLLRKAKCLNPRLRILGSTVISRIANDNSAMEEPDYWADYGQCLHAYSIALDRNAQRLDPARKLFQAQAQIPALIRRDFHNRRLRNHTVNLAAMHLAGEGVVEFLTVTSDDTSPFGLPAQEKRRLLEQARGLDAAMMFYPGADEVACTLMARLVNTRKSAPGFSIAQVAPADAGIVPPFEDVPVDKSVLRQLLAAGAIVLSKAGPDQTLLALNTPIPGRGVFDSAHAEQDARQRLSAIRRMMLRLKKTHAGGIHIAVADVAYANGADPILIREMFQHLDLDALHGFGAWNTAGNTLGTVIAQASCARHAKTPATKRALEAFTFHRLIEDWGYQHLVRRGLRERLKQRSGQSEPSPLTAAESAVWVESQLTELARTIPGLGQRFRIVPGSVCLPWRRTFEVDFLVESLPKGKTP